MTLQYRIRSRSHDDRWIQRVRLCNVLILQAVDSWCRNDIDFPTVRVTAGILFLLSPRFEPDGVNDHGLLERLGRTRTSIDEYTRTWPLRDVSTARELIHSIVAILDDAVSEWATGGFNTQPVESVAQQLVDEIVGQQYVIFYHKETTKRDFNHWGIG